MRPVSIGEELRIQLHERQQGRRMQLVEAELLAGEVSLARATGLKIRTALGDHAGSLVKEPEVSRRHTMPGGFAGEFTIVPVAGGFGQPGSAEAWFRFDGELIEGNSTSAVARCVAAADFGSGIAHELPFEDWNFPSLDLTVSLARSPVGIWTLLQSRWLGPGGGRASCMSVLSDSHGPFGEAIQTVLIEARAPR
jgi:hypothetical protein